MAERNLHVYTSAADAARACAFRAAELLTKRLSEAETVTFAISGGSTPALITLRMSRAGQAIVRVRWSPLLRASGTAVVRQHGAWTSLTVRRRGSYTLSAPY